jgi:hypothetical protein
MLHGSAWRLLSHLFSGRLPLLRCLDRFTCFRQCRTLDQEGRLWYRSSWPLDQRNLMPACQSPGNPRQCVLLTTPARSQVPLCSTVERYYPSSRTYQDALGYMDREHRRMRCIRLRHLRSSPFLWQSDRFDWCYCIRSNGRKSQIERVA